MTAIIGVNGVGKSTLLRSLSGLQDVLLGNIFIKGQNLKDLSPLQFAELSSVVLTGQPFSKNLTVYELIALGRQPYTNWLGTLSPQDRQHISNALELVDIGDLQKKKCYELSDGQLQKVLISRALAQDTPLILLDEPTTHLDLYHQAYVLKLLKSLTERTKKTILFSTHEINLALQLCDKIILMVENYIIVDSPSQLIEKEILSRVFPEDLILFDKATRSFRINNS